MRDSRRDGARAAALPARPVGAYFARPLSFRGNFAWALTGNVVYALCQWGMIMALARSGTPEEVGRFSLGMAVAAPVMMLANLQLRAIQATDARREYLFADYLGLRLVMVGLGLGAIGLAAWLSGYEAETLAVILAVGGAKAAEAVSDVFQGACQQRERMDLLAFSLAGKGALSLAALAGAAALTGRALPAALALGLAWVATLLGLDVPLGRAALGVPVAQGRAGGGPAESVIPRWRWPVARRLFTLSLPLGLTMMLISLNANIPRYFIESSQGEAELGVFSALAYLMAAGFVLVNALGQAATPRLARCWVQGDRRGFLRLLAKLTLAGLGLGGGGVLVAVAAGGPLLALVYGPAYAARADVLVWLMAAMSVQFAASFLGYGATAARCLRPQLPVNVVVCLATLAGSALLVPRFGLAGGAWAILASSLWQCVLNALLVRRAFRETRSMTGEAAPAGLSPATAGVDSAPGRNGRGTAPDRRNPS